MVKPRSHLTPAQIALQLDNFESEGSGDEGGSDIESDDDGLGAGNMSFDDEDGHDNGPEEYQETFIDPVDNPVEDVTITPPPLSPGSQDMFLYSPPPGDIALRLANVVVRLGDTAPQPAATEPPPAITESDQPGATRAQPRAPQPATRPRRQPPVILASEPPAKRRRIQAHQPNSGIASHIYSLILVFRIVLWIWSRIRIWIRKDPNLSAGSGSESV